MGKRGWPFYLPVCVCVDVTITCRLSSTALLCSFLKLFSCTYSANMSQCSQVAFSLQVPKATNS